MTDQPTKPTGIIVTIERMYEMVVAMKEQMDRTHEMPERVSELESELKKMKAQLAAMWVTHSLIIAVVSARLVGAFT